MTRIPRAYRTTVAAIVVAFAAAGAATAQTSGGPSGYYVAVPVAAPTAPSLVTHITSWKLQDGAYVAARAADRHQLLCRQLAAQTGPLSSFSVRGTPYDADALAQCNARATPATAAAAR